MTDRVEIDLVWDLTQSKLVGTPTFRNTKSAVKNLRNFEPKCTPPALTGEYEHYELQGIKDGLGGSLETQVLTIYPGGQVPQLCTGKPDNVPASRDLRPEEFTVVSPVALGMGGSRFGHPAHLTGQEIDDHEEGWLDLDVHSQHREIGYPKLSTH